MALYRYFQTVDALPDTNGPLFASLSPAAIKDANEAVRSATRATLTLAWQFLAKNRSPYYILIDVVAFTIASTENGAIAN